MIAQELKRYESGMRREWSSSEPLPEPLVRGDLSLPTLSSVTKINATELARQLTLRDQGLFRRISHSSFLGNNFHKDCPSLKPFVNSFNSTSMWIANAIIQEPIIRSRAKILSHFIDVADELVKIGNFNGVFYVVQGALRSAPVHRLRATWECVSKARKKTFNDLFDVISSKQSYRRYRQALHRAQPPVLPYLGVYLTDLTFISESNSDFTQDKVNFLKMIMVADIIAEIRLFQEKVYAYIALPEIYEYIHNCIALNVDEDSLFDLSVQLEPKQPEQ
jgi:hypothetical protein